jgi:hypothetical protein
MTAKPNEKGAVKPATAKTKKAPAKAKAVTTKDFIDHEATKPGAAKTYKRPPNAKQRKAKAKSRSMFPDGTSDSDRFSISGAARILGKDVTTPTKIEKKDKLMEEAKAYLPAPALMDVDGSEAVLVQIEDPKLRSRVGEFLGILLEGGLHKEALNKTDFSWNNFMNLQKKYKGLHELWLYVRDMGEEYRSILRMDEGHRRAVEGVEEPVWSPSGKYLGSKTLYSDKLLEMLMKADSPEKFRERKEVAVTGTVLNIQIGFDRDELRKEKAAADVVEQEIVDE